VAVRRAVTWNQALFSRRGEGHGGNDSHGHSEGLLRAVLDSGSRCILECENRCDLARESLAEFSPGCGCDSDAG
jgi:hypothetical protein